ncbi:hypothetical protein [Nocardia sp. CY41]|uniref:hypothetical protein n=1 Tax=Nocardia sp. CY41 TaxID=2608686 RepID=UPI001F237CE6|nr:hypothetical protein [Nocardia sp. CY41]
MTATASPVAASEDLLWLRGAAAGSGLALLMAGAVSSHLRNGDGVGEFAPTLGSGLAAFAYVAAVKGVPS